MLTSKQVSRDQEQCEICELWDTNVVDGICNLCYADISSENACKLGTLDKDNCEVLECTCGHHKDKGGDPNVDPSC